MMYENQYSYSAGSRLALPELAAFLEPFHVHFLRNECRNALDLYLTGLLTELPNKNCDTIAASIPGTSEQQLLGLLSTTTWDQDELNRQRVEQMLRCSARETAS